MPVFFSFLSCHKHTITDTHSRPDVPHLITSRGRRGWRRHIRPAQTGQQHVQLPHQQPQSQRTCSPTATDTAKGESEPNCTAQCTTQRQTAAAPTAAAYRGDLRQPAGARRRVDLHAEWPVHVAAATAATL